MKRFIINAVFILAIVAVGAGAVWKAWQPRLANTGDGQALAAPVEKLPNVVVRLLVEQLAEDALVLTGSAEPWADVTLSAETRGKIEWQPVEEGEPVVAGQELIKINTTTIQAQREQALADFRMAEQDLERIEKLRKDGISSPQEYDRALATRDARRAALRVSEIQLAQSVIRAPIDGVIDALEKDEGEYVDAGAPLVRIVQVHKVKVAVGVPEREIGFVKVGDRVGIRFDVFPDRTFDGTVYKLATSAEAATRTFKAEIELDNSDGLLKPGMIARARFIKRAFPDAITVPLFAVIQRDGGAYVFIEDEGVARLRPIEVGFFQGNQVFVSKGLNAGERLIVAGQRDLRDGQAVNVQHVLSLEDEGQFGR